MKWIGGQELVFHIICSMVYVPLSIEIYLATRGLKGRSLIRESLIAMLAL